MITNFIQWGEKYLFIKKADIERLLFYYLCGNETAKEMSQGNNITYEEFDRITYILIELKFYNLLMEFWDEFYNQFQEDIDKSNAEDFSDSFEREISRCKKWLYQFCKEAPTQELKGILKEIFDIS